MKGTTMAEPKRLLALRQDPALTQALRAARAQLGTPEHMRALREKLALRLAAPQAGAAAGSKVATLGGAKVWLVLAAAVAALVGLQQRFSAAPERPVATVQPRAAIAVSEAPVTPAPPAAATHSPSDTEVAPVVLPSAPMQRSRRAHDDRVRTSSATASRAEVDTDAEVALISSAQQALERDPHRALAALNEHARRFEHGVLAEEREVLRFDALVALGRLDEARMRARAFVSSFPKSAQRARLRRWLDARHDTALTRNPDAEPTPTDRVRNTEAVE
jgi:hypothetical protein